MPDTLDRLGTFVTTYNDAICKLLEGQGKAILPFHGEVTPNAQITVASDGFLVEYHPFHENVKEAGTSAYDLSEFDLNTLCQFFSARFLRVRYPPLGKPYELPTPVPDTPQDNIVPGAFGIMLHPELRRTLAVDASQSLASPPLPAIQVTPFVWYEQGVAQYVVPGRFKRA